MISSDDLRAIILACLLGMAVVHMSNAGCCCESSSSSSSPKFFMSYSSPPMIPPPPPGPAPGYYGGVPPVNPTYIGGPMLAPVPGPSYPPPPPMFSPPGITSYGPPPQYYAGAYGAPIGGGTTFTTYGSLGSSCFWMFGRKKRGTRSDENEDAVLFTPVKADDNKTVIGDGAVSTIDGRILIGNGNFYANRIRNLLPDPGSALKPQLTVLGETTSASSHVQLLTTSGKPVTTTTLSGPDYGYANISGQSINISNVSNLAAAPPDTTADWRHNGWKWIAVNGGPTTVGEMHQTQLTQTFNSTASSFTVIDLRDLHVKDTHRPMWNVRERRRVKRQCCESCGCCGGGGGMAGNMTNSNMGTTGGCGCECDCGCGCGCCCGGGGMVNPQTVSTLMMTTSTMVTTQMMTTTAPTMTTTSPMTGGTNRTG